MSEMGQSRPSWLALTTIPRQSRRSGQSTSGRFAPSCRLRDELVTWRCSICYRQQAAWLRCRCPQGEDVAPNGYSIDRATVRQKKTGRPVKFELTEQTRQAVDDYIKVAGKKIGESLFVGQHGPTVHVDTAVCAARIGVDCQHWVGPAPLRYPFTSANQATLIYRRTGNLRAVQLLLGHTKLRAP